MSIGETFFVLFLICLVGGVTTASIATYRSHDRFHDYGDTKTFKSAEIAK